MLSRAEVGTTNGIESGLLSESALAALETRAAVQRLPNYLPFGRPDFSALEIEAVTRVLRSGWIGMGPETLAFESELAAFLRVPNVVTVNSCTSALFLALLLQGIGPGDEVICPSLTWCATANAALYLGAVPVFCDVDPRTLCVTPESVRKRITARTRAVMVVHFGGLAADVEEIRAVVPEGIFIIEDAAHAFGSRFANDVPVGASGNLTCFSFYANKNLSTGEGGAVALFDDAQAEHARSLRQSGMPANAWSRFTKPNSMPYSSLSELGYKMNFLDLLAAIGRVQLQRQSEFQARRAEIAAIYCEELQDLEPRISFQEDLLHPCHARHLFTVSLPFEELSVTRDEFLLRLRSMNVGASIHYAPLHTMSLYQGPNSRRLPNTERLAKSLLTLPISSSMSAEDARRVSEVFRGVFRGAVSQ
jgi:dTDP-4-amino-4,6-dideoxygalactose transaminase